MNYVFGSPVMAGSQSGGIELEVKKKKITDCSEEEIT